MEPLDFTSLKEDLVEKHGEPITEKDLVSSALYPKVFDDYKEFSKEYGPVEKLDTRTFLVGPDIATEVDVSYQCSRWMAFSCLFTHPNAKGAHFLEELHP